MVRIIDVSDDGLSPEQLSESLRSPDTIFLRRNGQVVARLDAADQIDVDDEVWAHQPEQVERGRRGMDEYARRATTAHDQVKREILGE